MFNMMTISFQRYLFFSGIIMIIIMMVIMIVMMM